MSRRTSYEAYRALEASGVLTTLRGKVYAWLYSNGPATQNEINQYGFPGTKTDSIKPRLAELRRMGLVHEVGTRECAITGRNVIVWDVTGNTPPDVYVKPKTTKQRLREMERFIRERGLYADFLTEHAG
jgi:hypothetical protein